MDSFDAPLVVRNRADVKTGDQAASLDLSRYQLAGSTKVRGKSTVI